MATFVVAVTQRVEVNPAMMLVPLYHPVLAAKQLAEISVLSEGRLRVAASIGWNHREAESLGVDPATRGARFEEQIEVMRRLWSEPVVDHAGRFFELRQVGISPRPASVIPLWMGAGRIDQGGFPSPFAVRRAARIADGFKFAAPTFLDRDQVARHVDDLRIAVAAAGRDPEQFGIEVRMIAHETASGRVAWCGPLGEGPRREPLRFRQPDRGRVARRADRDVPALRRRDPRLVVTVVGGRRRSSPAQGATVT